MDILKILARSSNLQKSLPHSKSITNPSIPSAGASLRTGDDGAKAIGNSSSAPRAKNDVQQGIKRKRRVEGKEQSPTTQIETDSSNSIDRNGQRPSPITGTNQSAMSLCQCFPQTARIAEEDCRRILKSHKLKITLLSGEPQVKSKAEGHEKAPPNLKLPKKSARTQLTPQPLLSFSELRSRYGISRRLADNLESHGYAVPTEVQLACLPLQLGSNEDCGLPAPKGMPKGGRADIDLLTIAPTGSGKTLAYLLPTLQHLLQDRHASNQPTNTGSHCGPAGAIILAPTHELADQIVNEGKKLAAGTGLKVSGMRKGMKIDFKTETEDEIFQMRPNENDIGIIGLSKNIVKAHLIVTTPLMFLHALSKTPESLPRALPSVRYLILDEADVLLDPLFRTQTLAIWKCCTNPSLQTSLWSATIGSSIESLAQTTMVERRQKLGLSIPSHTLIRVIVGLKDSALPIINHRLIYAATEQGKLLAIRQLLRPSTSEGLQVLQPPFLVFTQTIARAVALHSELLYDIPPEAGGSSRISVLHSDLSDKVRLNIMAGFRNGEIWILITTDLLSRGIDFRGINGIVNYDIPNTGAAYIHRAGRTGRAGREGGMAVTLYTKEDIPYVKNIANVIAASQKQKTKNGEDEGEGLQRWLLDALPKVSKKTKKDLKRKGVEARRTIKSDEDGGRGARRMRISTKSGFDKRLENKRNGAIERTQRRELPNEDDEPSDGSGEEWGGIDA